MRIVLLGSGEFGCPSLKWLGESDYQLVQVITQPARRAGRGKKLSPTPVAALAVQMQLPVRETDDVNEASMVQYIQDLQPDLLLVIAFGQKIGSALLTLPACRAINLHGSLLPKYRGAAPINWAIINGERQTGLTVIELNENWDAGAILGQLSIEIRSTETAGELHDRLSLLGPELLADVLSKIAQGADEPIPQDESQACRAPKLHKADGAIDWAQPAQRIRDRIHGMWPWPGAYSYLQQQNRPQKERLTIGRAALLSESDVTRCAAHPDDRAAVRSRPGMIVDDMTIVCGGGRLKLVQVRPDNGKLMAFEDFANGRHLQSGDRFVDA